jgi:hypothetical protein
MFTGLNPQVWTLATGRLRLLRDDLIREKAQCEGSAIEVATYGKAINRINQEIRKRGYDPLETSPEAYEQD